MNKSICLVAATALGLFAAGAVWANPVTFLGQDQNPSSSTANSDNARTQFFSHLASGTGTEDFEGLTNGSTAPLAVTFPGSTGSITATLNGNGEVSHGQTGEFPTSGAQLWDTGTGGSFYLTFSDPISAFGFYGTDIGDVSGDLVLTLSDGSTQTINLNTNGSSNGNLLYFGFIDLTESYTRIDFTNTAGGDRFGFDDMTIGDLAQVVAGVPEPAELGLFGLGLLLIGLFAGMRRQSCRA